MVSYKWYRNFPTRSRYVYAAVTRYKFGDYKPYLYKTNDFGKNWTAITKGIPILGGLLTTYAVSSILMSDASRNEKVKALGGLLFGTLGATKLAGLGGMGGFAIGGPTLLNSKI